jgi:ribulose-5-phosphate 4-epimerase/fuculose-1-phosphate aldolase
MSVDTTDELISVCQQLGREIPLWTQGAGGNVSCKSSGMLLIKASGYRLDAVDTRGGVASLPVTSTQQAITEIASQAQSAAAAEDLYADILKKSSHSLSMRPSMETGMHLRCQAPWVMHFHALSALLMAHHAKYHKKRMHAWFEAKSIRWACIDSTMPGLNLAESVAPHADCELILLAQHGVILQGASAASVLAQWKTIETQFVADFGYDILAAAAAHKHTPELIPPCPWRVYFPDTVVHADSIKKIIVPVHGLQASEPKQYQLDPNAFEIDRNSAELWWATCLLYRACPQLDTVSKHQQHSIVGLPGERYRLAQIYAQQEEAGQC